MQQCLDPQVSPEVRETYFSEYLNAKMVFEKEFQGNLNKVQLYQVELRTEEIKIVPGIFIDGNILLLFEGDILVPVDYSLPELLYEKEKNIQGKYFSRIKLISWMMLGR